MAPHGTLERHILPAHVRPTHYDVQLEVDPTATKILGSVLINIDILKTSTFISLNSTDIKLLKVTLECGGDKQSPTQTTHDEERQSVEFEFEKEIPKSFSATLSIEFEAIMNEQGIGFYRTPYVDETLKRKYMASTQMEPVDARRVFPCFDEPALKASFSITLVADKTLTCLSNMNVISEELRGSDKKVVKFAKSPLMSTYLVAMVVGDFEYIETTSFRIPIRVYTTPGLSASGKYSLELAARTLQFYETIFDSPFPLPKMDMIAVHDMLGAMENWGLVTFMTSALLLDANKSGIEDRKRVASIVQHELAHQWFGNLVTMDFWEGLWLNEGFATWVSWYSNNVFYPEWNTWQDFVTGDLQKALGLDSLRSSHPVEVPVQNTNDINQTDDLFDSLSLVSGKDVAKQYSIWTKTDGYPVLTVTESESEKKITVRQDRFLQSQDASETENKTLYPVSLDLLMSNNKVAHLLLDTREMEISLEDMSFFKVNFSNAGFYRTLYTPDRLVKLGQAMNEGLLPVEDRIGLIADASALASSGYRKTSTLLGMLANLKNEKNPFVWKQITACLTSIKEAFKFEAKGVLEALNKFQRQLVTPQAMALGWKFSPNENASLTKFKVEMFQTAGETGDSHIIEVATKMFAAFAAGDRSAIHPNIRNAVYAIALKQDGSSASYEALLAHSKETKVPEEFEAAFRELGNTRNVACIQSLLAILLTKDYKSQDFYKPLITLRRDAMGAQLVWNWLQDHWTDIEGRLSGSLGILGIIVGLSVGGLSTERYLEEIDIFFKKKNTEKFGKQLARVLESMKANSKWVERDREDMKTWLKENGYLK